MATSGGAGAAGVGAAGAGASSGALGREGGRRGFEGGDIGVGQLRNSLFGNVGFRKFGVEACERLLNGGEGGILGLGGFQKGGAVNAGEDVHGGAVLAAGVVVIFVAPLQDGEGVGGGEFADGFFH